MTDINATINTEYPDRKISVDRYDFETIWLHMTVAGGSAYTKLSAQQARELATALNALVDSFDAK
jgi:hypothetical protein